MNYFFIIILFACPLFASAQNNYERKESPAYEVFDKDASMNKAIITARENLSIFHEALQSGNSGYGYFSLKVKMGTKKKIEHVWLSNITYTDGSYKGILDNVPSHIKDIKIGDTIVINTDLITDWFYIDNGHLKGGYTIRILRDKMSEKERKQFDEDFPVAY